MHIFFHCCRPSQRNSENRLSFICVVSVPKLVLFKVGSKKFLFCFFESYFIGNFCMWFILTKSNCLLFSHLFQSILRVIGHWSQQVPYSFAVVFRSFSLTVYSLMWLLSFYLFNTYIKVVKYLCMFDVLEHGQCFCKFLALKSFLSFSWRFVTSIN